MVSFVVFYCFVCLVRQSALFQISNAFFFLFVTNLTSFASQFSQAQRKTYSHLHTHTLAFHKIGPDSVVCILYCHNIRQTTTAANNILHFYVHVVHVTRTIPRSFYRLIEFRCMQIVCVFVCSMLRWFGKVGTFISDEKNLIAFGVVVLHEPRCSWQSENIYYYRFFFGWRIPNFFLAWVFFDAHCTECKYMQSLLCFLLWPHISRFVQCVVSLFIANGNRKTSKKTKLFRQTKRAFTWLASTT